MIASDTNERLGPVITISQPRYLPTVNYLQRICYSDIFVVLDIVQRQSRGFENRNRLLLPEPRWLTIPIKSSSRGIIVDALIDGEDWVILHKTQITSAYCRAPYFDEYLLNLYFSGFQLKDFVQSDVFSLASVRALTLVLDELELPYNFIFASDIFDHAVSSAQGPDKLLRICEQLNASTYLSGENGRNYGVMESFTNSLCRALFHINEQTPYVQHNQDSGFVPHMGFFDALFNCGRDWFRDALMKTPTLVP